MRAWRRRSPCSPATAGATALHGVITDPRDLGEMPTVDRAPASATAVLDAQIVAPPEDGDAVDARRAPRLALRHLPRPFAALRVDPVELLKRNPSAASVNLRSLR